MTIDSSRNSSACSGTSDWMKIVLRSGSTPAREPVGDVVERVGGNAGRVRVVAGQRVPVGDEIETVVLLLQRDPVLERADQVSEVQLAGRAHAADTTRGLVMMSEKHTRAGTVPGGKMIIVRTPVNIKP